MGFVILAGYFLFDFGRAISTISAPDSLLGLPHSREYYIGSIPAGILAVPNWFLLGFSKLILVLGLVLIGRGRNSRLGFALAGISIYVLSYRVAPIIYGGNTALILAAFLGAILPSVENAPPRSRVFGLAAVVVHLQISSIYFQSALSKSGRSWTESFLAVEASLKNLHYRNVAGVWLSEFTTLNKIATVGVLAFEYVALLLFAFGILASNRRLEWLAFRFKRVFVWTAIGFHVTTAIFLNLGIFPYASILLLVLVAEREPSFKNEFPVVSVKEGAGTAFAAALFLGFILTGLTGIGLPNWLPSQRFRYFAPAPDTRFVDIEINVLSSDGAETFYPLNSDDLGLSKFYRERLRWATSRFRIRSETWATYYCRQKFKTDSHVKIDVEYIWSYFDETNSKILREQRYLKKFVCTPAGLESGGIVE